MHNVNEIYKKNQHLALALEATKIMIWDWDLLNNRVDWSSSDEQLFGLIPGTFPETYEAAMALVHPYDKERVNLALNQARTERRDYHQELRIFESNGKMHWIEAKGRFFYNDEAQAVRMLGTIMGISDRKAREEQLRLLESVVVNTNDAVLITEGEPIDPPGPRIVYANPAFTQMTGYTLEEVLGKTPRILQGEKTDRAALDKTRTAMQNWQAVQVELVNYTKDGREFWVEINIFPIKDDTGWYTHWVSVQRDITERKRTEIVLKQSEERFRQIAENIQDVFWVLDFVKQQLIYISPAYERIWQRKRENLYVAPTEWIDSLHPDDKERVLATFYEKVHQEFEREYRIVRPDGTVRWIRDRGFPVKDEFGQLQRVIGIGQDITERKLAQQQLQQLNEELELRVKQRTLELERSQAILQQQVERERVMTRLTQEIRQSLNLTRILNNVVVEVQKLLATDRVIIYQIQSDWTGHIVAEAIVKEECSRILNQIFPEEAFPEKCRQRYLQGEVYILCDLNKAQIISCVADFLAEIQVRAELVVPIIQKQTVWGLLIVHQCSEPREWQTWEIDLLKQLTSQMAIAIQQSELYEQLKQELQERQRTEAALRQGETLFRSLSEFAPVGIYLCDSQGKNIYTNPCCQTIYGCHSLEESLGYGWLELVHPEDLQVIPQWFTLLKTNQEVKVELRFIHKDGTIRYCRVKSVPIFSELGEQITHVGIAEDITESLVIEKMKNEFISIVSHELKTPLTSIHGSLGLLAAGVLKNQPDTAQQMLDIAASDTERLVRLVNDILDLERLEANKVTILKQWCDADQLMRQAVKTLHSLAAEGNIKLLILPTSVQVWADSDRIIQTLVNLVSNAIKFSLPKTTVRLSVEVLPDHVLFKVQDQGRGIPNDKLQTIFGRFQQVDASDSRQKGGTGLGLAICRSIVQQHGGRIYAESMLGKGSVFYFTLPQPLQSEG